MPATFDTNNKDNIIKSITECNETLKNEFLLNKDCMEFLFSYNVNGNKTLIIKCSPKVRNLLKNSGDVKRLATNYADFMTGTMFINTQNAAATGTQLNIVKKTLFAALSVGKAIHTNNVR